MHNHSSIGGFARRLAHLRNLLTKDSAAAGDQGLKLLEEYLEYLALEAGYQQDYGSIGRYTGWLRQGGPLSDGLLDRAEGYAQVRNCLAHSYGLQTSPDLAAEIIDFLGICIQSESSRADQLMSTALRTINEQSLLSEARDLMLREGFSRLPVIRNDHNVIGLLTERDLVTAGLIAEPEAKTLTVGQALPPQAKRRFTVLPVDAEREQVIVALRRAGTEAVIITRDGQRNQTPLGIITHADLLYRMS